MDFANQTLGLATSLTGTMNKRQANRGMARFVPEGTLHLNCGKDGAMQQNQRSLKRTRLTTARQNAETSSLLLPERGTEKIVR
jgi:hypothetical protein